ncbi:MAG TPA: hypothetical protein VNG69_01305 [Casimicrobiaceae bacterium]|nr:hypothetical protein [Casimicrobiaceae bacterium]
MEATKSKPSHTKLHERIASVERRLENRRTRLLDDARESALAVNDSASKMIPVAAAIGAGVVALLVARRFTPRARRLRYYEELRDARSPDPRRGVRWASLAGLAGTVFRIATSPQVRGIVRNLREGRQRRY